MTRYDRLRKETLSKCRQNGHKMRFLSKRVEGLHFGKGLHTIGTWDCVYCGAWVMVDTYPGRGYTVGVIKVSEKCSGRE